VSGLFPFLGQWLIPQNQVQGYLLELISLLGAMFLLLISRLETDLALIRHHARTAMGVSLGGILVTLSSGFFLRLLLPDALLVNTDERLVFALFMATAMSIFAVPVIAKVLMDLKLMRRDVQTIEAHVLEKLSSKTPLSITLFNVSEPSEKAQGTAFLDQLRNLFSQQEITIKVLEGGNPAELILDEARKYDDLIVLGASEKDSTSKVVFNPMVDYLLRVSPCPTMVVTGRLSVDRWPPRRILHELRICCMLNLTKALLAPTLTHTNQDGKKARSARFGGGDTLLVALGPIQVIETRLPIVEQATTGFGKVALVAGHNELPPPLSRRHRRRVAHIHHQGLELFQLFRG
jgi:nucleotide-binding universal stress UspA family protein